MARWALLINRISVLTVHVGQVVILLEQQSNEYKVLGVGKVVEVSSSATASSPCELIPVTVFHVEAYASNTVSQGQQILWPKALLARYNPSSTQPCIPQEDTSSELKSNISSIPPDEKEDRLLNYGLQVIQLGVFLMQLNDTEAEGDGERSIINWKMLMLYYRCRPRGMKYAFEAMRFLTCVRALYTEQMSHRIIHGQFVNPKGGDGRNYANDLKMEHLICDNKVVLGHLRANKTLTAMQRYSKSTYGVKEFCNQFDHECNVPPELSKHTHASTTDDVREMLAIIHKSEPFKHKPGRVLTSFPNIGKTVLDKLNVCALHSWLTRHKRKLFTDINSTDETDVELDAEESASSSDSEDSDEEL